jgi:hypothetical protein
MPLEVRWFSKNMTNYKLVDEWFISIDDMFEKEGRRDDQYLFLPNSEDIGIKLRPWNDEKGTKQPSKLEIKWRKKKKTNFDIIDNKISGTLEEWVKWGWVFTTPPETTDKGIDFFSIIPNGPGIIIEKWRTLRKYNYQDISKSVTNIDTDSGEEGLQFEITKLICNNETWWSIGFEGIGKKNNELEFRNAVQKILKDFQIKLEKTDSCGYPEWLKCNFNQF